MTINNLQSALELWDNGFNLFPIKSIPNLPTLDNPSENKDFFKQPLISWKKYQDTRVSREDLYKWYEESPYLNVGIITNGLVIVDADKDEAVLWCHENLSTPVVSKTAKGKFETGDLKTKRQILQTLGSNLLLKDRKLAVTLNYPLERTKTLAESVQKIHERLEPLDSSVKQAELAQEYAKNEIWWR